MRLFVNAIIFVIIAALSACSHSKLKQSVTDSIQQKKKTNKTQPVIKKDTVAYSYVHLDTRNNKCEKCDYIAISYPIFKNVHELNDAITTTLYNYINEYGDQKIADNSDFRVAFKKFAKTYGADSDSSDVNKPAATTFDYNINIEIQDSSLIVLSLQEESSGGAHPNHRTSFLNWNTKANKSIELEDIFIEGYEDKLTTIAENIFRKEEGLSQKDSLGSYFFENGVFALNDNFRITPKGINFYYNFYEIKPYSEGPTDLLIPYTSIKNLLRPNTVISQYLK